MRKSTGGDSDLAISLKYREVTLSYSVREAEDIKADIRVKQCCLVVQMQKAESTEALEVR